MSAHITDHATMTMKSNRPVRRVLAALAGAVVLSVSLLGTAGVASAAPKSAGVEKGFRWEGAGTDRTGFRWESAGVDRGFRWEGAGTDRKGFRWERAGVAKKGFRWEAAGTDRKGFRWE
ncbi:hypothetical protein [Pseudokineococcus sp. 1T1Z-3]|uniref:hypothetical protein n=1 Tax=Pseudokineococcus sp. 1T1Z-3 TaxID=3132745 RepID=UPI0030AB85E0